MKINEKAYDVLAFIGRIVLPSLSVLVVSLGDIWGIPYKNEISQTIVAFDVFLNALLGITSANYYKDKANAEPQTTFNLDETVEENKNNEVEVG